MSYSKGQLMCNVGNSRISWCVCTMKHCQHTADNVGHILKISIDCIYCQFGNVMPNQFYENTCSNVFENVRKI